MTDLRRIHALLGRVRRRMRLQRSLDWGTTAAIPGVATGLVILWLWRMELISAGSARAAVLAAAGLVLVVAVVGALQRFPAALLASRLDRASGLADRLGTACDFSVRLAREPDVHPETAALMRAAIDDGVRAAPRANVRAAAPFRTPRDLRALGAFAAVAVLVGVLRFGPEPPAASRGAMLSSAGADPRHDALDPDDLEYERDILEELKKAAADTEDRALEELAKNLEALLDKAEKGEISKQELLAEMQGLEEQYLKGSAEDIGATLDKLKEQGKQLKKKEPTRKLGEALEAGDLTTAQKELERLADELEKGAMVPEDQKQLADALEKAAQKQREMQQKEDAKQDQAAQKQIDKKQDDVRRLERKAQERPQDEELKRTLAKERRELDKLEREQKDRQEERGKRRLERLSRDLDRAAENLRQKNQQQQSAQNMRRAADETRKVEQEMKQRANQQKMRSQLSDLKDALRRAKPRPPGQSGKQQARQERIREWQQRAGGKQGNSQAWRGQGNSAEKMPWMNERGTKQDQKQWGDQHDPHVMDDPTKLADAKFKEDQLDGAHGKGPSRRSTILTSAKKGFASVAYSKVFADYQKVIERVMAQEKVPQGYRYYVKRYFQRIKPHETD